MHHRVGLLFVGVLLLAACNGDNGGGGPTTPSNAGALIVLESQRLTPSATRRFCSVTGTLRNDNPFEASSIRIDWRAFHAGGVEIATAQAFEFTVPAGGRRTL